jgi:uncharacterized protein (TIGR00255 family)
MTGFGKAEHSGKTGKFTVEISSVNNRFLEISTKLPRQFFTIEPRIRELVGKSVSRGKINIFVGFEEPTGSPNKYLINKVAATAYYKQLKGLKKELKIVSDIDLHDLLMLPDVTRPEIESIDEDAIWASLKKVVEKGLHDLVAMRKKEGDAITRDMQKRLTILAKQVGRVEKATGEAVEHFRDKLKKRIEELTSAPVADPSRLEEEIALMAERTDVTEECTRFLSHIEQYEGTLKSDEPVGKKLNFILQELNREANTIASKCSDINISTVVISIKEEVERLREQVQNIE